MTRFRDEKALLSSYKNLYNTCWNPNDKMDLFSSYKNVNNACWNPYN